MGERGEFEPIEPAEEKERTYAGVFHPYTKRRRYARPVIISPGMGETGDGAFKEPAQRLADLGHSVYAITHTETGFKGLKKEALEKSKAEMMLAWEEKYGSLLPTGEAEKLFAAIPLTEFRKALSLIELAEQGIANEWNEKIDLIGHSQGGANALIAAFLRPDLFKRVILANPAGQSGKENPFALYWKFHKNFAKELKKLARKEQKGVHAKDTLDVLFGAGLYAYAVREGWALAHFDGLPFLEALARVAPEMKKKIFFAEDDVIFRAERIQRAAVVARSGSADESLLGEWQQTKGGHYNLIEDFGYHMGRHSDFLTADQPDLLAT
jgi:hypothetical protein